MTIWLKSLRGRLVSWLREDGGQGLTEYALILALIALVAVVALTVLGGNVSDELTTIGSSIPVPS